MVAADVVEGFANLGQSALAEDVEFVEAELFGHDHVELDGGVSLGRDEGGREVVDGPPGDEDAAGVDAEVVGEALDARGQL